MDASFVTDVMFMDLLAQGFIVSLARLVPVVVIIFVLLKLMDWFGHVNFKNDILPIIKRDPKACSLYFSTRLACVCLVLSVIFLW